MTSLWWRSQDSGQAVSPGAQVLSLCLLFLGHKTFGLQILPALSSSQKLFLLLTYSHSAVSVSFMGLASFNTLLSIFIESDLFSYELGVKAGSISYSWAYSSQCKM